MFATLENRCLVMFEEEYSCGIVSTYFFFSDHSALLCSGSNICYTIVLVFGYFGYILLGDIEDSGLTPSKKSLVLDGR